MLTACYARFSSDLQSATSIVDQVRNCREFAERNGWVWQEAQVYTDAAVSGASIDGRTGLQTLLAAAGKHPRPFDVLLVDDSSRVARDLADALRVLQRLRFVDVRVVYITQGIDSASPQAETLVAVHGLVDGLYLREMAAKIRRGLAGQLERGFATGGATYGYRAVPVPDPSGRLDPNGYPALLGKRLEVNDAEAAVIRRIFEEYATGAGGPTIVERLNVEGVKGPRGGRWQYGAVKRLLANERFTGKQIWGQRRFERRPGTRQLVARPVPRTEWRILERPELRIISDDLWTAVQRRRLAIAQASRQAMTGRMRGKDATLHSRHLFSGFLRCAICGGAITIVGGGYGSPRYGCIRRSKNGLSSCRNGLTVRAKVADAALLAGLRAKLLHPDTVGYITNRLAAALSAVMDARPKQRAELERARAVAQGKLKNLIAALEDGAGGAFMLKAIQDRETEIVALSDQLGALDGDLRNRLAVMPSWVRRQIEDTAGLLSESHDRARTEFRRLGIRFTVEPVHDEGPRPFLRAHGEGDFEQLAFRESTPLQPFTTVARSDPRSRR